MDTQKCSLKLSGNALKIIAVIAMTIDHIGVQILPDVIMLRIIGRLAFPIFAYMIAEGCTHTRNRARYFLTIGSVAVLCQAVYFFVMRSLYQCIFVTFLLSLILIYVMEYAVNKGNVISYLFAVIAFLSVFFLTEKLPGLLPKTDFAVDYGFFGVIVPVIVYFSKGRYSKLLAAFVGLLLLTLDCGGTQWYSLLSIPLLALYSGERGKMKLKWFFYAYYPLHLAVIYLISTVI